LKIEYASIWIINKFFYIWSAIILEGGATLLVLPFLFIKNIRMSWKIKSINKVTGLINLSICTFFDENSAQKHVDRLKYLVKSDDKNIINRHKHLSNYSFELVDLNKKKK
jgi:hypothetical protein